MKGKQVKMDEKLWGSLDKLGRDLKVYHGPKGNHSKLIREMASAAVIGWQESPYVCHSTKYVVLVTREGHVLYRQVQVLKLNKGRQRLPCLLEMKPEKRRDFLASRKKGVDEATWFKSLWLINYFGVWHGEEINDAMLLKESVDRDGTDAKQADLEVNQGPGPVLTRELVMGIQDYVQWRPRQSPHEYDRVEFPMDIPTRNLEALVVVDLELYQNGTHQPHEIADLELELRNRESARWEGIPQDDCNKMGSRPVGRHLPGVPNPDVDEIGKTLGAFRGRIEKLLDTKIGREPVVPNKDQRSALRDALRIPESFLYYTLEWPSPYFGVEVCIRWPKPEIKD
jgi:hypothetical protein